MASETLTALSASPMPMLSWVIMFFRSQWTWIPAPTSSFAGQTVIVTGANSGLGFEAAKHLARLDTRRLILAVRSVSRGEAAKEAIVRELAMDEGRARSIEVWQVDLGDYKSIQTFGERVAKLDRLDAVLQNAGILTTKWAETEGMESQVAVDIVGAMLLGLTVLPMLQRSAAKHKVRGRLSFVGSDLAYIAQFTELKKYPKGPLFDALKDKDVADLNPPTGRYSVCKLLLWYAVRWLAAKYPVAPESNVIINVQTPGACRSQLMRDDVNWIQKAGQSIGERLVARTTEVGARTYVQAIEPDLSPEFHGGFIQDCKVNINGPNIESSAGQQLAKQFVKELVDKLETIQPGITQT